MNILVFAPYPLWPSIFGRDLELLQLHLDCGDNVVLLTCNSELPACDANPHHDLLRCLSCVGTRMKGVSLLSERITCIPISSLLNVHIQREIGTLTTAFSDIDDLRAYTIENFDIGYAVAYTFVGDMRNPRPDLRAHTTMLRDLIISAFTVYRCIQTYLARHHVDKVYVFSGKRACVRAAYRACQGKHVPCVLHELGNDIHHYALWTNVFPHDINYWEQATRDQWALAATNPAREKLAAQFFVDQARGVVTRSPSYIEMQRDGLLPHNWDSRKTNIAIFTSSEDEIAAVSDNLVTAIYNNQVEGLEKILSSLPDSRTDLHLYLRMHPHLKGVENEDTKSLLRLQSPFLTIIPPEDPVSTYALIKSADKVLTFGSTVGIEAVFWGTPSVLAGPAWYQSLGGTYNARFHEEVMELLLTDLKPKDKEPALMYGYHANTYGTRYRYFTPDGLYYGQFKGSTLEPGGVLQLLTRACRRSWRMGRLVEELIMFCVRLGLIPRLRRKG